MILLNPALKSESRKFFIFSLLCCVFAGCSSLPKASYYSGQSYQDIRAYYRGEQMYNLARYDKAVHAFKYYIDHYPQTPLTQSAMYYLAKSYRELLDDQSAKKIFRQLAESYQEGIWVDRSLEEIYKIEQSSGP